MKLTDEQAEILAHCAACQKPIDVEATRRAAEEGKSTPAQYFCLRCRDDPSHAQAAVFDLGTLRACELIEERFNRAGLMEYFNQIANDMNLRRANQQN